MKKVAVIMGSKSDMPVMEACTKVLEEFGVPYDVKVLSAHRTIDEVIAFCEKAEEKYDVIIAAAGYAAHLGGVIAAKTVLPVIGVPLDASPLKGIDSLLSIVQMPGGIPVATVTIGKAGAKNAAVLAVEIMAIKYPELKEKLKKYREEMKKKVLEG
ncbi:5-(carboxyamino)imidazole ribonucleotide mutase [Desulfurobacterium pacificum]|uniref:N5-carboxyaminoimidazole ribonucleotide mutase n=1 Tax=Desulfurobacterium pacificum TaxID=240166 RepID=A0ABY1NKK2_9BACT|nr:5-(carboxyamino)imidazole ribonucleotide mutase [Desulfurobacterium pacificum]SMP11339.1 5-(carboxyamino)imidazole ribonucleotide mutase [Desulfurobacterium pacificum]